MGKKKHKIKFIDKKQAISFHLVAKAAPGGAGAAEEQAEEQAELDYELALQRAERRKKLGLAPEEESKGEDEEDDGEDDEEEESFVPKPQPDDRINLLNMAAAAEGIETRAERQAKKAAKETKGQKFYLQPNFRPGSNAQIPKDFPQELLYMGGGEEAEEEYWAQEDQKKYDLDMQAEAPSLLPHNYDYEKHLRPMTGRGLFMEAKRGDEMYDPELDPRDQAAKPVPGDGSSSSSTKPNLEEEAPANPELLASVEAYQRKLLRTGRRVRPTKDFVKALEGEQQEEEFEELQDDFVIQAMMGGGADAGDAVEEEGDELYEDGEGYCEEYEDGEEYDEEGEEEKDEDGDDIPKTLKPKKSQPQKRRAHDDDDEDDEDGEDDEDEDPDHPKGDLDAAFDKVLEEYSDGEIGELDHYIDEDPAALEGTLELEELDGVMDEYLGQKNKFKTQGGSIIDPVEQDLQTLTLSKLALVAKGEKTSEQIDQDLEAMLNPPVRDNWDAESILSTYSNTENHPRVLREYRRKVAGSSSSSKAPSEASSRQSLPAFQPALPVPAAILRQAARQAAGAGADEEDDAEGIDEEEDEDGDDDRANKGKARAIDETPEEKKKRKQAVKQAQREAKERKKALKSLYVQETAAAIAKQAKLNKANPPGVKKI